MRKPHGHSTRPHGHSVHQEAPAALTAAGAALEALHVCRDCAGELVHPLDWSEESPEQWRILLRCPDCERTHEGVFARQLVERLDDELDMASGALLDDLQALTEANMRDELELFVRALELDLIGPDDFQR
jgi:hypothetical protein